MRLLLFFPLMLLFVSPGRAEAPFWKTKPEVYERIKEQRAIIVSVKTTEGGKPSQKVLKLRGAGHVYAPMQFTYSQAKNFEAFPQMSSYIVETRFNSKNQQLFLHTQAFGYHARMLMKIHYVESKKVREIHFDTISGLFKGLKGRLRIEDYERRKSEISMTADFPFEKLPMPKFFVTFGLEVAMQKMASRMRAYVEEHWRQHLKEAKTS